MDPDFRWLEKVDSDFYFDKSLEEWRLMLIGYKQNEVALEAENAKLKKENDALKKKIDKLEAAKPKRSAKANGKAKLTDEEKDAMARAYATVTMNKLKAEAKEAADA